METNNEKLNAIQAKLRKLQKMYEGAKAINSEGEAAAAAAAIQRILTEYNLTMDEVGVEPEKNAVIQTEESGFTFRSIGGQWQQKLYSVICRYNFCRCFLILIFYPFEIHSNLTTSLNNMILSVFKIL